MACPFYRSGKCALVPGAGSSLASWANLSILGHKSTKDVDSLIIDYSIMIGAEQAHTWLCIEAATTAMSFTIGLFAIHSILLLCS